MLKSKNFENSHQIPAISEIKYIFRLYKIEDLDDVQIYNYLYFVKFFFGKKGTLTKYKSFFSLGTWTYTFHVFLRMQGARVVYNNIYLLYTHI